jgi:hypothetical protein
MKFIAGFAVFVLALMVGANFAVALMVAIIAGILVAVMSPKDSSAEAAPHPQDDHLRTIEERLRALEEQVAALVRGASIDAGDQRPIGHVFKEYSPLEPPGFDLTGAAKNRGTLMEARDRVQRGPHVLRTVFLLSHAALEPKDRHGFVHAARPIRQPHS